MLPSFVRKRKPKSMNTENSYTMEEQVPLSKSPSRASALDIEVSDAKENLFTAYNDTYTPNDDTYAARFLPKHIVDKLYPTNVPRAVQLLRKENIAVPACYLCVGLLQGLSGPFINVYPRFLEATEAQQVSTFNFFLVNIATYVAQISCPYLHLGDDIFYSKFTCFVQTYIWFFQ